MGLIYHAASEKKSNSVFYEFSSTSGIFLVSQRQQN